MIPGPLIFFLIVLMVVWMLSMGFKRSRRKDLGVQRACINCGTIHPGHANFCRRCGRKLP